MKAIALVSGGKDSCFNMMCAVADGYEIVALANLEPAPSVDELDSYMYQTVGHQAIEHYAEAMGLPLHRRTISGSPKLQTKDYEPTVDDEVEDLYELLREMKTKLDFEAVAVGAILSEYQTFRVLNICKRLDLKVLAYLWQQNQQDLLKSMIAVQLDAILIKVAALGLVPEKHLGRHISDLLPHLLEMESKYGCNPCGEGGEYESLVLDCPLFSKRLVIDSTETVIVNSGPVAPVAFLNPKILHLEEKTFFESDKTLYERLSPFMPIFKEWIAKMVPAS